MSKKIESDIVRSRGSEEKFLVHVYDQMFATINRIHYSIWNMVIVVGGGIGVLNLYTKFLQNDVEKFYGKYRAKNLDDIWKIRTSILLEMIFVGGILFFPIDVIFTTDSTSKRKSFQYVVVL